jgi:outer membrane protein OmpA-like peptidoglycan-associated protein
VAQPPFTKVSALISHCFLTFIFILFTAMLASCASSDVSRDAANNIDLGVQNAKNLVDNAGDTNIADTYQNSSQTAKGAVMGGVAGGVAGALYSGVGVVPGLATGIILGAAYGSYIDSNMSLEDQLENRGVNTIVLGDEILISIPSARIFNPYSSSIKPQAFSTLVLVKQYMNRFTSMLVRVSGYTADTGAKTPDLALSTQQAQRVAKFLHESGLNTRVLYASGYGGTHLVTNNTGDWDSDNYRIEISLKKLYV